MYKENFMQTRLSSDNNLQLKMKKSLNTDLKDFKKGSVLIFSPHPDDAEICLGAFIFYLISIGVDVHVAIMTSGVNAVRVRDVQILKRFWFYYGNPDVSGIVKDKELMAFLRECEVINGLGCLGVSSINVHFLHLTFYNNLKPDKEADLEKINKLIERINPYAIFAAGDFQDPHGTHEKCFDLVWQAVQNRYITPRFFVYKGSWDEFREDEISLAFPYDQSTADLKREAICCHHSQRDPLYPGNDERPFYQRAFDRGRAYAQKYNTELGANYFAIEAFKELVVWKKPRKNVRKDFEPIYNNAKSKTNVVKVRK